MPRYFFTLSHDVSVVDDRGTELADETEALAHARTVAREISTGRTGVLNRTWSDWTMSGSDESGRELFSFSFSDLNAADGT